MIYITYYKSPIGKLLLAAKDENLLGLWMEGQKYYGGSFGKTMVEKDDLMIFQTVKKWLDSYFRGENPSLHGLSLELNGSDFQKRVWGLLVQIPYGQTRTYGELAKEFRQCYPSYNVSPRAIGNAVGHNPISILVPCHRVVGISGLTGYAGGVERKAFLLNLEGVSLGSFVSKKKEDVCL